MNHRLIYPIIWLLVPIIWSADKIHLPDKPHVLAVCEEVRKGYDKLSHVSTGHHIQSIHPLRFPSILLPSHNLSMVRCTEAAQAHLPLMQQLWCNPSRRILQMSLQYLPLSMLSDQSQRKYILHPALSD